MEKVYATIISHQDIIDQLNKLNPNKSCGPDKIHPQVRIKGNQRWPHCTVISL